MGARLRAVFAVLVAVAAAMLHENMHTFVYNPGASLPLLASRALLTPSAAAALRGKRVLIAGASQGIGREIALEYARAGAHLVLSARREPLLSAVAGAFDASACSAQ
jgi:FlaA1/EpsC-like NDP-sugar epimerase